MRFALLAFSAAMLAGPALAQQPGVPAPEAAQAAPPVAEPRVNQLIIYGDDPCPQSQDPNEVTVCARLPDDDRYRVPPNLRNNPNDPASQAWAGRAIELSYVGRTGAESCSPVGSAGFTGCFNQIVSQARAERRAEGSDVNWSRMVEEARAARAARIDAEAQAAEEDAQREEAARPR